MSDMHDEMWAEKTDEYRELKPCPFCGDTDLRIYRYIDDNGAEVNSKITCMGCLISVHQEETCSVDDQVEAWNRRPE